MLVVGLVVDRLDGGLGEGDRGLDGGVEHPEMLVAELRAVLARVDANARIPRR